MECKSSCDSLTVWLQAAKFKRKTLAQENASPSSLQRVFRFSALHIHAMDLFQVVTPRLAWPLLEGPQYGGPLVSLARQSGNLQNPSSDQWKEWRLNLRCFFPRRLFWASLWVRKTSCYGVLELAKVATCRYFMSRFVSGYPVLFRTTIAFNIFQLS